MPPFSTTYNYSDPTRGILFIGGKLIFLPWVTAIEPYRRYSGDPQPDDDKKSRVYFQNKCEMVVDATVEEIHDFIKKAMGGNDEQG